MDRMKKILPTGGTGTLKNYYRTDSGYVFAKTGSLSNVLCLSGYIYTKNNLVVLIFNSREQSHGQRICSKTCCGNLC